MALTMLLPHPGLPGYKTTSFWELLLQPVVLPPTASPHIYFRVCFLLFPQGPLQINSLHCPNWQRQKENVFFFLDWIVDSSEAISQPVLPQCPAGFQWDPAGVKVKGGEGYTTGCIGKNLIVRSGWGLLDLTPVGLGGKLELLQIHMYLPSGIF